MRRPAISRDVAAICTALGALLVGAPAHAQEQPLTVQQLTPDVYVASGGGSKTGGGKAA